MVYRREAVALAGAQALREAADRVIQSRIEPIASEVKGRWKHLFTNNGLTFKADGSITRVRDGEELAWDTLSGGERTWARIITHLLVMATTTSLLLLGSTSHSSILIRSTGTRSQRLSPRPPGAGLRANSWSLPMSTR